MNKEIECSVVKDLLPLYVDGLTSENTSEFIENHLAECEECQKEYMVCKEELGSAQIGDEKIKKEVNYMKKVNKYQKINLLLGAILSFVVGASLPVLRIGIPVLLRGGITDYQWERLKFLWSDILLQVVVCGIVGCVCYLLFMFWVRRRLKKCGSV